MKTKCYYKRPASIPAKVFAFTAMIIAAAPMAENNNPYTILLLYPPLEKRSYPPTAPYMKSTNAPM
jgi:hypothetical protein